MGAFGTSSVGPAFVGFSDSVGFVYVSDASVGHVSVVHGSFGPASLNITFGSTVSAGLFFVGSDSVCRIVIFLPTSSAMIPSYNRSVEAA